MRSVALALIALVAISVGCGGESTSGLDFQTHRFVVNQDGSGLHQINERDKTPTFKQSSQSISFESHGNQMAVTWTSPGQPGQVQRQGGFLSAPAYAHFSPDEQTLLIGGTRLAGDRRFYLFTIPAAGGTLRKISDEVLTEAGVWSPEGKWIATASYDGDVVLYRPDGSQKRTVVHLSGGDSNAVQIEHLGWSRDGSQIYFTAVKVPPET